MAKSSRRYRAKVRVVVYDKYGRTNEQLVALLRENQNDEDVAHCLLNNCEGLIVSIARKHLERTRHLLIEDLVQWGRVGLLSAIRKFDSTLGVAFTTYAYSWIDQAMQRAQEKEEEERRWPAWQYHRRNRVLKRLANGESPEDVMTSESITLKELEFIQQWGRPFSLDDRRDFGNGESDRWEEGMVAEQEDLYTQVARGHLSNWVVDLISLLTHDERWVVVRRYGLEGHYPMNYSEIRDEYVETFGKRITHETIRQYCKRGEAKMRASQNGHDSDLDNE